MRLYTRRDWRGCRRDRNRRLLLLCAMIGLAGAAVAVFGDIAPPLWRGWP